MGLGIFNFDYERCKNVYIKEKSIESCYRVNEGGKEGNEKIYINQFLVTGGCDLVDATANFSSLLDRKAPKELWKRLFQLDDHLL